MQPFIFLIAAILMNVVSQVLIKTGMNRMDIPEWTGQTTLANFIQLFSNPWIFIGLVAIVCSLFAWMAALSRIELTIVYPIATGLGYVLITIAGHYLLGESLSSARLLGIVLIVTGVVLIGRTA